MQPTAIEWRAVRSCAKVRRSAPSSSSCLPRSRVAPSELAPAFESAPGSRWGRVNRGCRPVQPVHDSLVCRNCEQVPHHNRSSPNPLRAAISGLVGRALRRQHDISHGRTDAWLDRPAGVAVHSITISPTMPWSAWLLPSAATIPQRKSVTRPAATGTNHHSAVCPG